MSAYTIQPSFTSGELSPSLYGRPDLQKYSSGLCRCENFIIHPHGGISKRPGMRFIAKAKGKCRLVEFEYSIDQTYVLEFGDKYVRFFRDGEQITSGGARAYTRQLQRYGGRETSFCGALLIDISDCRHITK